MNDLELSPDDPRLTAYALGELDGDERAAVEAAVRRDPELRAVLEEIRATAAQVEAALAAEAAEPIELLELPKTNGRAHANGHAPVNGARTGGPVLVSFGAPEEKPRANGAGKNRRGPPKVLRFPQMYFIAGGLAAACFTIVAIRHPATQAPTAIPAAKAPPVIASIPPAAPDSVAAAKGAETEGTEKAVDLGTEPAALAQSFVQLPSPGFETRALEVAPVALAPVPVVAIQTETLAGGLPLLEQAKAIENAAIVQGMAAEKPVGFAPLVLSRVPLVSGPPLSLTVGLPREAAMPLVPATVARGGTTVTGSTTTHAVVRPQEPTDARRIAELRAAGSEAERARLTNEARKNWEAEQRAMAGLAARVSTAERPARLVSAAGLRSIGPAGEVRVVFTVDVRGAVQEPRVLRASEPRLAERALEALRAAKFEAATKGDRATASRLETTIAFRASGEVEIAAPVPSVR